MTIVGVLIALYVLLAAGFLLAMDYLRARQLGAPRWHAIRYMFTGKTGRYPYKPSPLCELCGKTHFKCPCRE